MPRKSNACETCRRRKVKCDEVRPVCLRCARQGHACGGYVERPALGQRRVVATSFRDQTGAVAEKAEASYAKKKELLPPPPSPPTVSYGTKLSDEPVDIQVERRDHDKVMRAVRQRHTAHHHHHHHPILSMDEGRERRMQLMSSFVYACLPKAEEDVAPSHFSYMYIIQDISDQHPAIPAAVDSLCCCIVAKQFADEGMMAKAKTSYGAAVRRLVKSLAHLRSYAPEGTLAAIFVLGWCELNIDGASSPNAWENHIEGCRRILEYFGPTAWNTDAGRRFSEAIRYITTIIGLVRRKAVIFTRPEWRRSVEAEDGDTPWIELLELASQIPGLLEEADSVSTTVRSEESYSLLESNLRRSLKLRAQLVKWHRELEGWLPDDAIKLLPIRSNEWWQETGLDSTVEFAYIFSESKYGFLKTLHWWSMVVLNKHLLTLQSILEELSSEGERRTSQQQQETQQQQQQQQQQHPLDRNPDRNPLDTDLLDTTKDPLVRDIDTEALKEERITYAIDLARTAPCSFSPGAPPVTRWYTALSLKLAAETFEEYRLMDKWRWCRAVTGQVERVFNIPEVMRMKV